MLFGVHGSSSRDKMPKGKSKREAPVAPLPTPVYAPWAKIHAGIRPKTAPENNPKGFVLWLITQPTEVEVTTDAQQMVEVSFDVQIAQDSSTKIFLPFVKR